jgi:hypothetical protein
MVSLPVRSNKQDKTHVNRRMGPICKLDDGGQGKRSRRCQSNQTEMKPASFSAFPSNVAVARQPNRRLRASIKQSAKSPAESFQE